MGSRRDPEEVFAVSGDGEVLDGGTEEGSDLEEVYDEVDGADDEIEEIADYGESDENSG